MQEETDKNHTPMAPQNSGAKSIPTPMTDARLIKIATSPLIVCTAILEGKEIVQADFARELERTTHELASALVFYIGRQCEDENCTIFKCVALRRYTKLKGKTT